MVLLALMEIEVESLVVAEINTIVTFMGMLCAMVQFATGYYAAYGEKKISLLKTNPILYRAHTALGGFATVFCLCISAFWLFTKSTLFTYYTAVSKSNAP